MNLCQEKGVRFLGRTKIYQCLGPGFIRVRGDGAVNIDVHVKTTERDEDVSNIGNVT